MIQTDYLLMSIWTYFTAKTSDTRLLITVGSDLLDESEEKYPEKNRSDITRRVSAAAGTSRVD